MDSYISFGCEIDGQTEYTSTSGSFLRSQKDAIQYNIRQPKVSVAYIVPSQRVKRINYQSHSGFV